MYISKKDTLKITLLKYIKPPFFIIIHKKIENEINLDDIYEIANSKNPFEYECLVSCGINYKSENEDE